MKDQTLPKSKQPMTTGELADLLGARLEGDDSHVIHRMATLASAGPDDVSFLTNNRYLAQAADTRAGAILVSPDLIEHVRSEGRILLVSEDAHFAQQQLLEALHGYRAKPAPGISDTAIIDPTATIGQDVHIGHHAVIEAGATVGDGCVIHPLVWIGENATLGQGCEMFPHVAIYHDCVLGDRVTLHANCVIGQDGFGYAQRDGEHVKLPPIGHVIVEDDVEMGACCSVDRGTMEPTVIGAGTKFSNSVTIGHGSVVGKGNLFVAQVGLAGSVRTGDYVAIGGQTGIAPHLHIGDGAQIAAHSGVMHDIPMGQVYGGAPAIPLKEMFRLHRAAKKLPELAKRIKQLEKQLAKRD